MSKLRLFYRFYVIRDLGKNARFILTDRSTVYGTGAVDAGKGESWRRRLWIRPGKKGFQISRAERFRYRCRYFRDSGIIGGKDFGREAPVKCKEILLGKYLTRSSTWLSQKMNACKRGGLSLFHMKRLGT